MQESQRRKETMRFFNMLNEPERTKAIANYDDKLDKRTPSTIIEAFDFCFAWENTPQFSYWANIYESIRVGKYNFKTEPMEQQSELDYHPDCNPSNSSIKSK